jgi:hypothetical protein
MLTLLGAQPASAADLGLLDRLASFWGTVAEPGAPSLWNSFTGWLGFDSQAKASSSTVERGFGIDPNGLSIETPTPGTTAGGSN